ncbi:hypothetical protein BCR42DRAFT_423450 [Absidia repens]|uniref:Uncharacterized protein n=1 Tax=Absidia repens TaxID=90262 RepID=A0A1X2I4U2_9FUNG|nr:hypothetical protein BCR42DRAFT_423450 [Absidia repens]
MASPTNNNNNNNDNLPPTPPPPIVNQTSTTNLSFTLSSSSSSISSSPELLEQQPSQSVSRPPSYKLDTHIDLDALEIECQNSIQSHQKIPRWRHQFHGVPLVFWLVLFVMVGIVSLFIPQFPPMALVLWLPLIVYFIVVMLVHLIYRRKTHSLQQVECQLAAIQQRRQRALTQVTEYDNDLYFLHAISTQHTHPFTTLLPPPPSYQKNQ